MMFRTVALGTLLGIMMTGCTGHYGISGPDDLGLAARFSAPDLPVTMNLRDPADPSRLLPPDQLRTERNEILSRWIVRSDFLCADYQLQLSRAIRDTRLATDTLATILTGLATIMANPAMTRPLAGAGTIVLGVGGDVQSDLFLQQAGDVVATALQALRTRERAKLQQKLTAEYADYTLEQGLVDVQRYDRETCNLNAALNEIRASLNIAGPAVPTANNAILPLPAAPVPGAPAAPGTATPTAPAAITMVPPTATRTPEGGLVVTPGRVITTPMAPPAGPMPPAAAVAAPPPTPARPQGRTTRGAPAPAQCRESPPVHARKTQITDYVRRLEKDNDIPTMQKVAAALNVTAPGATATALRRSINNFISLHVCTDADVAAINKDLADHNLGP